MGEVVATDAPARPAPAESSHYRPQLDGLRALAVYLVVAYHAGIHAFTGGFIGVDVFFVLSGYLVTLLLLRDLRSMGRIDFRRFYSRRFRRLLPAAFVTLVVTAAVYTAVAAPVDVRNAQGGFRSAFLYVANWHFISQSNDYFAANVNTNPVVHFWSLAIEEQFYLCWPLLLSAAYLLAGRARDRQWKVVRLIIAAGFVVSLVAALHLSTVDVSRAYYGTDTRAYELLAGGLLAITPRVFHLARQRVRAVQALAPLMLAALVIVATSVVHLGPIQRGVAATAATSCLIVALEAATAGGLVRVLSSPSAVYLGRVSYGTYLWHWPVIVIATQRFHPNPVSLFALTCLVGTALASLSYEMLEQRVRLSSLLDRYRTTVIAVGLSASIVGGLVIVPTIVDHGRNSAAVSALPQAGPANKQTSLPVPRGLDFDAIGSESGYRRVGCFGEPVSKCYAARGSGPRMLVIGDSHATAFTPAFVAIAHAEKFTLAMASVGNCPWQHGVVEAPVDGATQINRACRENQDDWYGRVVPQFDPDIVVLIHRAFDDPAWPGYVRLADNRRVIATTPASEREIQAAAKRTIDQLRKPGRKIVILEPLPIASQSYHPLTCLSQARYVDACRYVARPTPTRLERYYRSIANGTDIFTLDLDRLVCPYLPICDPIVGGVVVKRDQQHITADFSHEMAEPLRLLLEADGSIKRRQ